MSRRNRVRERRRNEMSHDGRSSVSRADRDDEEGHEARFRRDDDQEHDDMNQSDGGGLLGLAHLGARHPVTALAVTFGVGFGLGVLATAVLGGGRERRWWESGRMHDTMSDAASKLRKVPGMIADHLPSWAGG